jgi:hypothetical protein
VAYRNYDVIVRGLRRGERERRKRNKENYGYEVPGMIFWMLLKAPCFIISNDFFFTKRFC